MKKITIKLQPGMWVKMKPLYKLLGLDWFRISEKRRREFARGWYEIVSIDRDGYLTLKGDALGYRWPLIFFEAVKLEG